MKTDILTEEEKAEIAKTARLVVQEPDTEGFWSQVGDYFSTQKKASDLIEPRPTAGNK